MYKSKVGPRLNVPHVPRLKKSVREYGALSRGTLPGDIREACPPTSLDVPLDRPDPASLIRERRQADRVLTQLRHSVFGAFDYSLDRVTAVSMRTPAFLCWRSKVDTIELVRCEAYRLPRHEDPLRPFIVRVSINSTRPECLERVARAQRLTASPEVLWRSPGWKMELSMLPHETLALVPFLVGLVRAHEEQDASLIPEPAVPIQHWTSNPMDWNYAWTKTALAINSDYEVRSGLYAPRLVSVARTAAAGRAR